MDSFTLYRERIGESLTRRLADAIAQEIVSIEEASIISQEILDKIDIVKDHKELIDFIDELAHKWPLFGPILVAEQAEKIEEKEENALSEVSTLLKENKIDEAAAAAESATAESQLGVTPPANSGLSEPLDQPKPSQQTPEAIPENLSVDSNNNTPMQSSDQPANTDTSLPPDSLPLDQNPIEEVTTRTPTEDSFNETSPEENVTTPPLNTEYQTPPSPDLGTEESTQPTQPIDEIVPPPPAPTGEETSNNETQTYENQSFTNGGNT